MKNQLEEFISFKSNADSSTIEIRNIFFKNFNLICRDNHKKNLYLFEDNKLIKRNLYKTTKPERIIDLDKETFEILQTIFTIMTMHHHELQLSQKKLPRIKRKAKNSFNYDSETLNLMLREAI